MHICCIAKHFDKEHHCSTVCSEAKDEHARLFLTSIHGKPGVATAGVSPSPSLHAVPVINLARLRNDPATRALVIQDIARACREWGCFQKAQLSSRDGISRARSLLKHYANPLEEWVHFWPVHPPTYKKKMGEYAVEIQRVSMQLMDAILQGLGLRPMYLQDKLEKGMQFLALNNYPQFSHQGDKVGLGPHSDYCLLTILLQSSPGLEVMPHKDNSWAAVPAISGALHVHIGDHLEVLSNGQLKSLVHRAVLNPDEARISITSIHGLSMDEKVSYAKELVDEHNPKLYRRSSFHEFLDFLPSNIEYNRFVENLKIDRA